MSKVRAPAVATAIVLAALCFCPLAQATDPPPATTPTSTTPDAPPPDPYKPPAPAAKPKPKASHASQPAPVHSAPVVVHRPTYSPPAAAPAPTPVVPVHRVQTRRVAPRPHAHPKPHRRKVVHKRRHHVAAKPAAPKPVKVNFNPFANLVASSSLLAAVGDGDDRGRYLWLAGFAFAVLAAGGLSLHVLSVRVLQ